MRHRIITVLACLTTVLTGAVLLGATPSASAAWAITSTAAPAKAAAAAIPSPDKPTVTGLDLGALGTSFTITWPSVIMTNGMAVTGYLVTRTTTNGTTNLLAGGTCAGTAILGLSVSKAVKPVPGPTQSCTETALLAGGKAMYQITPLHGPWRGASSGWGSP